jgi:hypothetical protein
MTPTEVDALIARLGSSDWRVVLAAVPEAAAALAAQAQRIAKQGEFKSYTHQRLDELGVPHTVPSPHTDAGCRVGGRFDWVAQRIAELEREVALLPELVVAAREQRNRAEKAEAALHFLERHVFERKWGGTIGHPSYWMMAGPYRHVLATMKGETLIAAIAAALAAAPAAAPGGDANSARTPAR